MRPSQFLIAALVLLLDQVAKAVILARFSENTVVPVIPGFFRLVHVENTGMAFGLFSDSSSPLAFWVLTLVSVAVLGVLAYLLWKNWANSELGGIGLAVILGGAAGNVVDRLARGKVIDFLDFYIGTHHWPAFNVADAAIVIGAALLLFELKGPRTRNQNPNPQGKSRELC